MPSPNPGFDFLPFAALSPAELGKSDFCPIGKKFPTRFLQFGQKMLLSRFCPAEAPHAAPFIHSFIHSLTGLCWLLAVSLASAQSDPFNPPLPPIDFQPEEVNGFGKWYIHIPTLAGWHYSLEELGPDHATWELVPDGQFYGTGQTLKYFVTDGPLPAEGPAGPPPQPVPVWQLRWVEFDLELQQNGQGSSFRLLRDVTTYTQGGNPVAVPAWDASLEDFLPPLPVGSRMFIFQSWDDPVAKIMWQTEFHVTVTAGPPPAESLPPTAEEPVELAVFQQVKAQLLEQMIHPPAVSEPSPPGAKRLIRLRRTPLYSLNNGIPDWFFLQNNTNRGIL